MLQTCAKLLRVGSVLYHHPTLLQTAISLPRPFSVSRLCPAEKPRDFGLPNPTWNQNLMDLYNKFLELSKNGSWKQIPSYNTVVHYLPGDTLVQDQGKRLFTRNQDKDGVGLEYSMFCNQAEQRVVCLVQTGPYLEGAQGLTHGGCIATIIDTAAGTCALYNIGKVMTANLNVNYRNPIPLGHTVIVDSKVEKIEGRKVHLSCQVRSHDDAVLHTEATALFIKLNL
ncbi:acyl-coenzyme A thioesterase THEM4 [Ascaphus truei]|uniref:acyl-coenzyme A thioesterase THEM4 n=1 Tax=Ascaphus truei TaxID=8439 RepID=UPI003F59D733